MNGFSPLRLHGLILQNLDCILLVFLRNGLLNEPLELSKVLHPLLNKRIHVGLDWLEICAPFGSKYALFTIRRRVRLFQQSFNLGIVLQITFLRLIIRLFNIVGLSLQLAVFGTSNLRLWFACIGRRNFMDG